MTAPPWSQSHGLQPSMSLVSPQCCGCEGKIGGRTVYTHCTHRRGISRLRLTVKLRSSPDTDRSYVRQRGACRSNFLSPNHTSFLQVEFPAGYRYTLPKHTAKQWSNRLNCVTVPHCGVSTLCVCVCNTFYPFKPPLTVHAIRYRYHICITVLIYCNYPLKIPVKYLLFISLMGKLIWH